MSSTKRLTNDIFVFRLLEINKNIFPMKEYINSKIKLPCKCLIDGFEWMAAPKTLLAGNGCPKCKATESSNRQRLSVDEIKKRLFISNPNIEIVGEYFSFSKKIDCYCKKHNKYFSSTFARLRNGTGCKDCSRERYSLASTTPYNKFIDEFNKYSNSIEMIGEYKNITFLTLFKCKIDGHEWYAIPKRILSGIGCPKCAGQIVTNEEFNQKIIDNNIAILPLERYTNSKTKILCRCLIDGYEWKITPNDIFNISGCPLCKKMKMRKYLGQSPDDFIKKMKIINPNLIILGEYVNRNTKILTKCLIDGFEWFSNPGHLLNYHGCPECNQKSRGEKIIKNILINNNIPFVPQKRFSDCKYKNMLPFDFYLPTYNFLIEYQGYQHYTPVEFFGGNKQFQKQKLIDNIKNEYCLNENIKLIEIAYWDINNIEKIITEKLNL